MSIALVKTTESHQNYTPLIITEVEGEEAQRQIRLTVAEWQKSCEKVKVQASQAQLKSDYIGTAGAIVRFIYRCCPGHVLVAKDKSDNLQGVAIAVLQKSRKKQTPFVEICFLVTAFWNTPFQNPESPNRAKGAGSALLAKATKLEAKNKCLFLSSEISAQTFYDNVGFLPTRRQIPGGLKKYKLPSALYEKFISNWSQKAEFPVGKEEKKKDEV